MSNHGKCLTKEEMENLHKSVQADRRLIEAAKIRVDQAIEEIQSRCAHLNAMSMGLWGIFCQDCGRFV